MLSNIPTNIVTGFLGVGKTSAILGLLEQKPATENWAVLVNEFGSIGIDGAIYAARGVAVKEIPGGCMCCAAGLPLQVAVNRLLKAARPQRLLIEPSGLGHPKRVLDTLRSEHLHKVLDLRANICLVDPRHLLDTRYTTHENFIDQIALADVLVANKIDQADNQALQRFDAFAEGYQPRKTIIAKTQFGQLDIGWLDVRANTDRVAAYPDHHNHAPGASAGHQDGYQTAGWVFPAGTCFDFTRLKACFEQLDVERIKAVIQTEQGWFVFNSHEQALDVQAILASSDSRVEIISRVVQPDILKQRISACVI